MEQNIQEYTNQTTLNPILFDGLEIKPEVREVLLKIANYFWDSLELDINYQDILLLGSSANYSWTENSDIDLHIVIDFSQFDDPELIGKYFNSVKSKFNESHDLKIGDNEIELYVQDSNNPNSSIGVFSILNNEWVQDPIYEKVEIPDSEINQEADKFKQQIDQLVILPPTEDTLIQISTFVEDLKQYRQSGLDKNGEYSIENLSFKELRNSGYIEKLLNYKNEVIDKTLVTEIFDKPIEAYSYDESGDGTYMFTSDSGNQYVVYIDIASENRISIDFGILDETGDIDYPETNVGELYKIMSTIIAIAKDYINKHPEIEIISWSSVAKRGQKKIGDTQRDKLYKLILKKQGGLSDKDIKFINGEWWAYLKGYNAVFENNFLNLFEDEIKSLDFLLNIKEKKDPFGLNAYAIELAKGLEETYSKPTQTQEQIIDFKTLLLSLTNHLKNKLNITPLPKLKFIEDDTENAKDILGTTAYYDPSNKSITLYTYGRHPKDVLRSYSHEMIHHMQNLENRLNNISTTNINEDDYLKELEREAYEKGNMLFREWENALENN